MAQRREGVHELVDVYSATPQFQSWAAQWINIHTYIQHTYTHIYTHTYSLRRLYISPVSRENPICAHSWYGGWLAGWLAGWPATVSGGSKANPAPQLNPAIYFSLPETPSHISHFFSFFSFFPSFFPPPDFSVKPSISKRAMYASCGEYTVADGEGKGREGKRGGGKLLFGTYHHSYAGTISTPVRRQKPHRT